MPPKAKIPQPIDRPLSRAYLREFSGWSTAYPPGLSDPTSLRLMENMLINRDSSVRVRPGMRYMSYSVLPDEDGDGGVAGDGIPASSHETFFLNDGSKAYLYAVREDDLTIGFRVLANTGLGQVVHNLTDAGIAFTITPSEAELNFTAATRYVKFLQIDNKIFALSDAGETMREFFVGTEKSAKVLVSITRPEWTVLDKLEVLEPEAAWINSGTPISERVNLVRTPSFEVSVPSGMLGKGTFTDFVRSSTEARSGTLSLRMNSKPTKRNIMQRPLGDVVADGLTGWFASTHGTISTDVADNALRLVVDAGAIGLVGQVGGPMMTLEDGVDGYRIAIDPVDSSPASGHIGMKVNFYNSAGTQVGSTVVFSGPGPEALGRRNLGVVYPPAAAAKMRIWVTLERKLATGTADLSFNNVSVVNVDNNNSFFDGNSGANFFWEGTADASPSAYHPPVDIITTFYVPAEQVEMTASLYTRAGTVVRDVSLQIGGAGYSSPAANSLVAWTRVNHTDTGAAIPPYVFIDLKIEDVPRGEYHYVDDVLVEYGAVLGAFFDGDSTPVVGTVYRWDGTAGISASREVLYAGASTVPSAETKTADTLVALDSDDNDFSFGFFYTFNNEIGESAASQATIAKTQRSWSGWKWEEPNAAGEPNGTEVVDPALAADQLVAIMPEAVFDAALLMGAVSWNLYLFTWSNQDPVPVSAIKVGTRELSLASVYDECGWIAVTPAQSDYGTASMLLPSLANRYNFSAPSSGGQGLVAADRMILVKDPAAAAVIRWTSNQQGSYTDFSANKGGGYKTLTSGNLQIPAVVKLWQNPQSADTLTILCLGVDGYSTGYYMAPAQVASQSEAVNVMGFEETTASPGTTSPYGCEVHNNALYHPLDEHILKSTASNYNINHKSVTDQVQDQWRALQGKDRIVSSQHDNRLYFIVHNPSGEPLEENCFGNEIWVFDAQSEGGTWSRWLVQAVSLRKVEQQGQVFMSVIRPDGIFYFDEGYASDDYVADDEAIEHRPIPWYLETNTQGANRAHDAWCFLQALTLIAGNFTGTMRYGIRSWTVDGKPVEISKVVRDLSDQDTTHAWDLEDQLQIRKNLKEWYFYASSETDEDDTVLASSGQLNLVQYRYAPVTVNVGYEHGSIETFEYGRATVNWADRNTDSGVPIPVNDQRRP